MCLLLAGKCTSIAAKWKSTQDFLLLSTTLNIAIQHCNNLWRSGLARHKSACFQLGYLSPEKGDMKAKTMTPRAEKNVRNDRTTDRTTEMELWVQVWVRLIPILYVMFFLWDLITPNNSPDLLFPQLQAVAPHTNLWLLSHWWTQ